MKKFHSSPQLIKATIADSPIIENMWYYYVYDLTRYCGFMKGWKSPTELSFKSDDISHFFTKKYNHLFLIQMDNEYAGFVLVTKPDNLPGIDWYMSQFYIISKYQRTGIGQAVAKAIFEKFPGEWSVEVLPDNTGAYHFWRKIISQYSQGNFSEIARTSEQRKTSENPDPYPMIMLRFKIPST